MLTFVRQNRLFILLASLFMAVGILVGTARYITYIDGFDYTIFSQTLWHYSNFNAPSSSMRDVNNILGDHFHPLLVVLTPLYWIWNNPAVLLIVQPFFFALSSVPLYLVAKKHFNRNNALFIATAYLMSHGLQFALYFDFHEIALAVPVVSLLIYAIDTEKYKTVIVACVMLCLLKEEMVLLSAMAGIVLICKRRKYALGIAIFVGSLAFFMALTKLIMPALAGRDKYNAYWTYDSYGSDLTDVIKNAVSRPFNFISNMYHGVFQNSTKTATLWVLALSCFFSIFLSWYGLLAIPNLAVRLMSDRGTYYWNYWFHYGAILMPIIFFSFIDVLRRYKDRLSSRVVTSLCISLLIFNIGLMIGKGFPFSRIVNPSFYSLSKEVRQGENEVQKIVGKNSSITAPVVITPHFSNRESIHLLTDKGRWYIDENIVRTGEPNTDYVILNTKLPITDVEPYYTYGDFDRDLSQIGYKAIYSNQSSGWIIYKKIQ